MTLTGTIATLHMAADRLEEAECDANAKRLRSLASYLDHATAALTAVQPLIDASMTEDRGAIRDAVEQHREATFKAIEDELRYCPYDCDRCHDTDMCPCENCKAHRAEYSDATEETT